MERIDDTHANATAAWREMGKPDTLHPAQVKALESASALIKESLLFASENGSVLLEMELTPQGAALITIETA